MNVEKTTPVIIAIRENMHKFIHLLCFVTILQIALGNGAAEEGADGMHVKGIIGVITDNNSRSGREEIVAIKMALEHFYHYSNQRFGLQIRNSQGDPLKAALAGLYFPILIYTLCPTLLYLLLVGALI